MEPLKVKIRCHNKKCGNSGDSIRTVYHPSDTFYCFRTNAELNELIDQIGPREAAYLFEDYHMFFETETDWG